MDGDGGDGCGRDGDVPRFGDHGCHWDRTLAFDATGLTGTTSGTVTLTAGTAAALNLSTPPSANVQSGVPFAQQPVVQLQDGSGNAVSQAGVDVTVTIATGDPALGGTVTVATDAAGTATFTDLVITGAIGDRTLAFDATGLTGVTSGTVSVGAGGATQLALVTPPSASVQSGTPFVQQPVVQLQDGSGNAVSQAGTDVTATIATGDGTLGGTMTVQTDGAGTATFTDLVITGVVGDRTLSFDATGLTGATSGTVSVTAGGATQLALVTPPSASVQSGTPFAQQPVVQLQDGSGNTVSQAGTDVTATIATGDGTLGGTMTVQTDGAGTATFTDLVITGVVGDRTLSFDATGLTGATSGTVSVTAGGATQLALVTPPSASVQSGTPFAQQPVVQLQDGSGNTVNQAGVDVTATIATGDPALGGSVTVQTDAAGTVTFTDLVITGVVGDRTLSFDATGLTGATSGTVSVTAGGATQLALVTPPSASVQSGTPFAQQPVVQLQDGSGNAVSQENVDVTATIATGDPVLGGSVTVQTDAGGTATFTDLVITGSSGTGRWRLTPRGLPAPRRGRSQ